MAKYLVQTTEVYRVGSESEAQRIISEAKSDKKFELKKYTAIKKDRKEKKEIVDEWVQVTLVKTFNDEKAPDAYVEITYDVDNGNFPGMGGDADYEEEEEFEENAF